ncbi:energy-coupling factor transporter transmembrane component T family protein [Thermococcus gammatolerans]|uniref:Cobalt transport protein, cbiQ family n=1 Tax=Thermococcus gammatolerans (strain DSM 15229 / JCM 11827 / EJ3) TaxID=593117 RepID=C5A1N4_THEGJ|nr:energy-coupling factor transporter transmembrane component T [Thermococcus gammatolerans]ACS34303.1 Cobalt transport protein, cbiQ family [Thermococcus gammatolerans EJ3]
MRDIDELDARVKIIATLIVGISLLHASRGLALFMAFILTIPLMQRKAFTPGFLTFSLVGLLGGVDYFLRLLALMELGLLFSETMDAGELTGALLNLRLPSDVALSAGLVVNGLQNLERLYREISEAQASRGVKGSFTSLKARIVPLLIGTVLLGTELGEAIEARGYQGDLRLPYRGKFGLEEALILAGSVLLLAVNLI